MAGYSFKDAGGVTRQAAASSLISGLGPQVNITDATGANTANVDSSGALNVSLGGSPSIYGAVNVSSIIGIINKLSVVNSSTALLGISAVFTGTSEEVKDFSSIVISVFSDVASATDGLSIQQSSNGTNWDITDTYTIAAATGKTFSVQPAARFFRVVYTNGGTGQASFRLQTVYHTVATKSSSQRSSDAYTNETDLEQVWAFNSFWNGASWDRMVGNTASGALVQTGQNSVLARIQSSVITIFQNSSILSVPVGSTITVLQAPSIVGTYAEDAASASGDKGFFVMGVRNDTMSSVTSADGDYSSHVVGPAGEMLVANSPITKWLSAQTSVMYGTSVQAVAPQGASVFTYITGLQIANDSGTFSRVKITGGLGSVLSWTVAPANGGSNIVFPNPIRTGENSGVSASISGVSSVYVSMQGFTSKT